MAQDPVATGPVHLRFSPRAVTPIADAVVQALPGFDHGAAASVAAVLVNRANAAAVDGNGPSVTLAAVKRFYDVLDAAVAEAIGTLKAAV